MQSQTLLLEDWLRGCGDVGGSATNPPPISHSASAQSILRAWSILREKPKIGDPHEPFLRALQTLVDLRSSLHVADPQAKLLLSNLPSCSPPSRIFIFHLLSIWARKSSRPSPSLLQSAISVLSPVLLCSPDTPFPSNGVLLLGALCASPAATHDSRKSCLDLLCKLLKDLPLSGGIRDELLPETLAGIGYALTKSGDEHLKVLSAFLLGFWSHENGPQVSLSHGLMLFSLVEWLVSGFIASDSMPKIESLCHGFSDNGLSGLAVVMASAGVLRAFRRANPKIKPRLPPSLRKSIENSISSIAEDLISRVNEKQEGDSLLLRGISIALARCGPFNFHAAVLKCICLSLLQEIFPLLSFFERILHGQKDILGEIEVQKAISHADSVLFKEAGAISGVLCSMYAVADGATQEDIENQIWRYCREFYSTFRSAFFWVKGKKLAGALDEIAEAFFLMVVLFSAEATKAALTLRKVNSDLSVNVLSSFSCVEYLRRIRLPEYTEAVRKAVLAVQEDPAACLLFVDSMPSYAELTNPPGFYFPEGARYSWAEDEIQTARVLFYLRVIPTCISRLPGSVFGKTVAPAMFLYMHHDLEKVARSAHSVFSSFITSGMDHDGGDDDEMGLKEKLVFYYIERSLEAYPGRTPFEGMASGVAALARHLPAGSPSIFYCIRSLVEKAFSLYTEDSDPYKKVVDLLLHLITIVDIQVLPYLLKQMAGFTARLPKEGKNMILGDLHALVAESDDVARKPTLVSWVQSLSYLSSQTEASQTSRNPRGTTSVHPRL